MKMTFMQEWKEGGSQRFWARAYHTSVHLQKILAIAFPLIAVVCLILYFVFAHGLHMWYTASFWMLLSCAWALPPCLFYVYLYMLKRKSDKGALYDLDDENLRQEFESDRLLVDDDEEEDRNEREGEGIINDYEEEGDEDRPPKKVHKHMKKSFSLDFIAEGYVEHKFVPTVWNGLGISACVFGLIASFMGSVFNFLVGDAPGGIAGMIAFFTVGSCMYLIIHRSLGVKENIALTEMVNKEEEQRRNARKKRILEISWKLVCVIAGLIAVCITILAALQSFVYWFNIQHYDPPGKMYDIGDSRKMHMDCNGTGGPTVVFLHGWGGQAYDWALVRPSISKFAKTCAVDRTGYGWTDPPSCLRCPRTAKVQAKDLDSLFSKSIAKDESILFVAAAEAILDVRVFVNTYKNYKICGIVCVDCVDTNTLNRVGAHLTNPIPDYWDMWRNLLPTGLLGVMAAAGNLQKFDMINLLPVDIHPNYIQNELKPKYPETVVMDQVYLPQAAQEAIDAGGLGALKMIVMLAGKGLNATGVSTLSTNSSIVYIENAPHDMEFHQVFANKISDQIRGAISYARFIGCAPYSPLSSPSSPPSLPSSSSPLTPSLSSSVIV